MILRVRILSQVFSPVISKFSNDRTSFPLDENEEILENISILKPLEFDYLSLQLLGGIR